MLSEAVKGLGERMFAELETCHQFSAPSIDAGSADGEVSFVQCRSEVVESSLLLDPPDKSNPNSNISPSGFLRACAAVNALFLHSGKLPFAF